MVTFSRSLGVRDSEGALRGHKTRQGKLKQGVRKSSNGEKVKAAGLKKERGLLLYEVSEETRDREM